MLYIFYYIVMMERDKRAYENKVRFD